MHLLQTINKQIDIFLFAAGLGTRLKPITDEIPKPMVKIHGKPIISYALDFYHFNGFTNITLNTFYLAHAFDSLKILHPNINLNISKEDKLLGHAGGLKNAQRFFDSDIILAQNADTILYYDMVQIIEAFEFMNKYKDVSIIIFTFDTEKNPLKVRNDKLTKFDDTTFDKKVDAIGLYLIKKSVLELISEDTFIGMYGKDDLIEILWQNNLQIRCIDLKNFKRYEVTTIDDYNFLNSINLDL
jgi:NDP-sugar pyrophosphorylase family protein